MASPWGPDGEQFLRWLVHKEVSDECKEWVASKLRRGTLRGATSWYIESALSHHRSQGYDSDWRLVILRFYFKDKATWQAWHNQVEESETASLANELRHNFGAELIEGDYNGLHWEGARRPCKMY